jgi:hypothetical protein
MDTVTTEQVDKRRRCEHVEGKNASQCVVCSLGRCQKKREEEFYERDAAGYNDSPREGHNAWYMQMFATLGLTMGWVMTLWDGRYNTEEKWRARVQGIVGRGHATRTKATHKNSAGAMAALLAAVDFERVGRLWADPFCGHGTFYDEALRELGNKAGVWQLSDLNPQVPEAVQEQCVAAGGECKIGNALAPLATWAIKTAFVTSPNFSGTDAAFVRLVSRCAHGRAPMVAFLLPNYWVGGKSPVDVREELWRILVAEQRCAVVDVGEHMPRRNMATLRWYLVFSSKSRRNKALKKGAKGLVKL